MIQSKRVEKIKNLLTEQTYLFDYQEVLKKKQSSKTNGFLEFTFLIFGNNFFINLLSRV